MHSHLLHFSLQNKICFAKQRLSFINLWCKVDDNLLNIQNPAMKKNIHTFMNNPTARLRKLMIENPFIAICKAVIPFSLKSPKN